jgi:hypothetical protein
MKKWIFLLFLFPLSTVAQYDFETRYFTINAESLPEVEDLLSFTLSPSPLVKRNLNEFQMNAENYRKPVDMATAMESRKNYEAQTFDVSSIRITAYGFGDTAQYSADSSTKIKNIAYKEQRGLDFLDPCPPFGICS